MTSIEKLLSISSGPLSRHPVTVRVADFDASTSAAAELLGLLETRNGFYAFESALHVFPAALNENEMTLSHWNSQSLWRYEYGALAGKMFFFAEDAFGGQFCIDEGQFCSFDPETGSVEFISQTLEGWAKRLLEDYRVLTGWPLLSEWQRRNGPISPGKRLVPAIPFVLGGEYSLANLNAANAVNAMKFRGYLAGQIKDLPDGTEIKLRFIDDSC
jgi:hypothetical protein